MPVARVVRVGMLVMLIAGGAEAAAQLPPPAAPAVPPTTPAAPTAAPQPRTFTAPVGLLFSTVRADRVADFERVVGYLQAAFAKSTNEGVRTQARGWRIFKAAEAGPSGSILYVFIVDPTIPGADYGLGRILAEAYPDQTQLQEIWKLYTGAVTGGSLLNLTPVKVDPPAATEKPTPATEKPPQP